MPKPYNYGPHHKTLTRRMAKYLCFFVSGIIIISFLTSVAVYSVNLMRKYTEQSIRHSSEMLVHEYGLVSNYLYEETCSELKQFSKNRQFAGLKTHAQRVEWFNSHLSQKPDFFCNIAYATLTGDAIAANNVIIDVSDRPYFTEIVSGNKIETIHGPYICRATGETVIVVSQGVYDLGGTLQGVMFCSVKLSTLAMLTEKLDIKNDGRFFIIGDDGKFICHYDQRYLGQTYVPSSEKYKAFNSQYFFEARRGVFETISSEDRIIQVYLEAIEKTPFTCGITVDTARVFATFNQFRTLIISVVFITVILICLLTYISTLFLNMTTLREGYYDQLTNLWTRPKFEKEAQNMLDRNKGARFVLMEMDFRGFKFLNQSFGSEEANKVLVEYSKAILTYCKKMGALCGRGYADHFYLISKIDSVNTFLEDLDDVVQEFEDAISPLELPAHPKYGITFVLPERTFYNDNKTIQDLIGEASYAKGTIKENILQVYAIYSSLMAETIEREQRIERHMEKALDRGEFYVMYQPKISLTDDKIQGAEALVRWNSSNPKLGELSPGDFVPVFERNGFIVQLDFEVYEMVFKFLREQINLGNPVVPISVNMSRNHSNPDKFVREFVRRFNKYDLPPNLIEIEILERASEGDAYNLIRVTEKLHQYGFSVAMDDFGSGQSSLNMLNEVPIDVLKFDQNFLRRENTKTGHQKMITTLIELGKQLNKKTLFEGVETEEQRDMLKELNCDQVQGYFYSKPLYEKDFVEFVKQHR